MIMANIWLYKADDNYTAHAKFGVTYKVGVVLTTQERLANQRER